MALTQISTAGVKDDAVTSGKIPANAVGTSEIADQAVDLTKLPHGTSSNDGKFLRANNGADPTFETISNQSLISPNGTTGVSAENTDIQIYKPLKFDTDNSNTFKITVDGPTTLTKDSAFLLPEDGSNGQFLKTNGSGALSFATVDLTALSASNLTSGTIPDARFPATLPAVSGANLTGISSVGGATGVDFNDDVKARFGTGNDLEIFHDGTTNRFQSNGLKNFQFNPKDTDVGLKIIGDGAVEAYHDGAKKLETTSTGINVTGGIRVGGDTAANELDDYEEGTFSSLHFLNGWGYTGDGSNANNGPVTGSHSTGRYTKIGDIVYIHFRVNIGGVSYTNANQIHMGYPPFYADDTYDRQELGFYVHTCANSGKALFVTTKATSKYYFGFHQRGSTGTSNFTGSNGGTSFDITVNGFYRVE